MVCEKCRESVGSARYCPSCGTPTQLGKQAITEETRFQSLGDAIASSYISEPRKPRKNPFRRGSPVWFLLALVVIVVAVVGTGFVVSRLPRLARTSVQTRTQPQTARQLAAQRLADQRFAEQQIAAGSLRAASPVPAQASTPSPTQAPTSAPSATPSPASTASPTSAPTATPTEAAVSTAPATIHNAPLLVRSIGTMKVGKRGSCGGQDATIDVPGYPRGCTVFDAVSSGPLKNGRGTVLIVPVSTSEDVSDTAYGLLYLQTDADAPPHYLAILPGGGSGRLTLRVQNGLIVVQSDSQTEYFTYDGHRIKPV